MDKENEIEGKFESTKINRNDEEVRPWARFFARTIDHCLYIFGLLLLLPFVFSAGVILTWILVFIAIIAAEGFLLSKWGYTLGKYLFAIQVRKSDLQKLSFEEAAKRSWLVIFEGMWLMIPLFSIIGGLNSYVYLTSKGKTSWDEKGGFIVRKARN